MLPRKRAGQGPASAQRAEPAGQRQERGGCAPREQPLCWVGASGGSPPAARGGGGSCTPSQTPARPGRRQSPVTAVSPLPAPCRRPPARLVRRPLRSPCGCQALARGPGSRTTGGRGTPSPASTQPGAPGGRNRRAERNQRGWPRGSPRHAGSTAGPVGRRPCCGSRGSSYRSQGKGATPRTGGGARPPQLRLQSTAPGVGQAPGGARTGAAEGRAPPQPFRSPASRATSAPKGAGGQAGGVRGCSRTEGALPPGTGARSAPGCQGPARGVRHRQGAAAASPPPPAAGAPLRAPSWAAAARADTSMRCPRPRARPPAPPRRRRTSKALWWRPLAASPCR